MPAALTYPGVYIEEIPSGVRTITGVATSITAFVGRAPRGPINDPVTINSFADYERKFGGLSLLSSMSFTVRDFYRNGGSQAIIVRVHNGASAARISLPAGSGTLDLDAANVGSWGNNLSALVDYDTKDPTDTSLFNLAIFESDSTTQRDLQSEKFLNVSISNSNPRYLPRVLEQGSNLVRVRKDGSGNPIVPIARPDPTVTVASPPASPPSTQPSRVKATPNSGRDGSDVGEAQFVGTGMQAAKTGLFALEKADLFNLLCIPPLSFTADVTTSLLSESATYCKERRAMLIVDPPSGWTRKETAKKEFSDQT
ncbi:MAG: phage tail sheath family protein, partial [Deltaproteobacteria bacterium]|nr:phage tail sheath family protein [Deltaproteobacteria bacterium]